MNKQIKKTEPIRREIDNIEKDKGRSMYYDAEFNRLVIHLLLIIAEKLEDIVDNGK